VLWSFLDSAIKISGHALTTNIDYGSSKVDEMHKASQRLLQVAGGSLETSNGMA
jgi:hypothetical protein